MTQRFGYRRYRNRITAERRLTIRNYPAPMPAPSSSTRPNIPSGVRRVFTLLGYTFGRSFSSKTGRAYFGASPSQKRVKRICETISEMTGRDQTQRCLLQLSKLNKHLELGPYEHENNTDNRPNRQLNIGEFIINLYFPPNKG